MHIVFALVHEDTFRHMESVARCLLTDGHDVTVAVSPQKHGDVNPTGRALNACFREYERFRVEPWILRRGPSRRPVRLARELINYSTFYRPAHPSVALRNRWQKYIRPSMWKVIGQPKVGKALASPLAIATLRLVEKISSPVPELVDWLKKSKVDVVLASPFITAGAVEIEYVKAAKAAGIPTAVAVASWDNLTTKGTFHLIPDVVFVWNEALKQEAVSIHGVPADKIFITGSPTFDYWFETKPTLSRSDFCLSVGLEPMKPYLVYLCSSRGMIASETQFISSFASNLRKNQQTNGISILVRPHPTNRLDWSLSAFENIKIWPPNGEYTDTPEAKQGYFHTLFYCQAVLGINSSSMVESTIADKPCITILDERYQSAQTNMGHFRHLVEGDFMEMTRSSDEAVSAVGMILHGQDLKKQARHRFVQYFIRPNGLDRSAARIMADQVVHLEKK